MNKINPLDYIAQRIPAEESVKDVSAWFKDETMELNFGEYVGRPAQNIEMHQSFLAYFFAEGWYVDAVMSGGEGGEWKAVSRSTAVNSGSAATTSSGSSTNNSSSSAQSSAHTSGHTFIGGSSVSGNSQGSSSGTSNSSGSSNANGTNTTNATAETVSEAEGGPYWYAYSRIRLRRRKLQAESVLKDMIKSFTDAYNEGREVNNARYDELVSLYALMLSRTEDEANAYATSDFNLQPLIDELKKSLEDALKAYRDQANNLPDDWLKSRIDEINRKFNALVGQTKSKMVSEGTYNSTVWPTTLSGIERDRQYALTALKDETVKLRLEVYGDIAKITAGVGQQLVDAQVRIFEALQKQMLEPTNLRNTVFKWMLDFMERREDDYPGLDQLVTVADRLGYGEGATGGGGAG